MVIQGRKKPGQPNRPSPCQSIKKIALLQKMPMKDDALDILHKVAIAIAPIMRENNLKVGLLCEFYPKDKCLLGLNVNKGQKMCIRLRQPFGQYEFLPFSDILGTALHELVHNTHGPHNNAFYATLEEYKKRYMEISTKSALEATGFVSLSERLGGSAVLGSVNSARLKKLKSLPGYKIEAKKLGGEGKSGKKPTRELILEAIERRKRDGKCCAEGRENNCEPDNNELEIVDVEDVDGDEYIIKAEGRLGSKENGKTSQKDPKNDNKRQADLEIIDISEEAASMKRKKRKEALQKDRVTKDTRNIEVIDLT